MPFEPRTACCFGLRRQLFVLATLLALVVASAQSLRAGSAPADWPQFRGPNASGLSPDPAPVTWNLQNGENILWQKDIPGLAHACPIIWRDALYLATAVKPGGAKPDLKVGIYGDGASYAEKETHEWRLWCLDKATGKLRWDKLGYAGVPRLERHTKASHCNSTPATDGQRLVAIFGSEGLFCFDMNGQPLWHKDLGKQDAGPYDDPKLQWGFASSPILHDGKIFVQCDVSSEQYLAAFDARDGHPLWRTTRHEAGGTWCTPTVAIAAGRKQVLANGWKHIGGFDLDDGHELWRLEGGGDIPVPTPVVAFDLAYFTSAHGKYRPIRAIRLDATGDITPPSVETTNHSVVWCHPRLGSYMQTPIIVGPLLFSCDWQGVLTCVDARTGALHFSERLGAGGQAFTASPVAAGTNIYFASEQGEVFVVAATRQFHLLANNHLDDLCLATPAISGGTLFYRTPQRLIAVGKGKR